MASAVRLVSNSGSPPTSSSAWRMTTVVPAAPSTRSRTQPERTCPKSTTTEPDGVISTSRAATSSIRRIGGAGWGMSELQVPVQDRDRCPGRVVEAGPIPTGRFEAGVVGLTVVDAVGEDRAGAGAPGPVGGHQLRTAVVVEVELQERRRPVGPEVPMRRPAEPAHGPPLAGDGPERVGPRPHEVGDVVGADGEAMVVRRPARAQHLVAHHAAVEVGLDDPEPGDVQPGEAEAVGHLELGPEVRGRTAGFVVNLWTGDEAGPPVVESFRHC